MGDSRVGLWDSWYERDTEPSVYGDPKTAQLAAEWLNEPGIQQVEDWGCGHGGFKTFLAPHQTYIGVDGSKSHYASVIADLVTYRSSVDAVHLRHVLEHNVDWRPILRNALASFRRRGVLTVFTPLSKQETVLARYPDFNGSGVEMVDISLPRAEVEAMIRESGAQLVRQKRLRTKTQYKEETIYFLSRE